MHDINDKLSFGQYCGLSIREIYQGTLVPDRELLRNYLMHILNDGSNFVVYLPEGEFISKFEVTKTEIHTIGEIFDPSKPLNDSNRVKLGNIQAGITSIVNLHFKETLRGIGVDIKSFNKSQDTIKSIGGDPEYLVWCENNVSNFQLSQKCKDELETLPVARLTGIDVLYIGSETYQYTPKIMIETFKFKNADYKALRNHDKSSTDSSITQTPEHDDNTLSDDGASEYGYESWDEMGFNEGFDGDIDAWNHFNE